MCATDRERGFLPRGGSASDLSASNDLTGVGPSFVLRLAYSIMGSNSSFSPPHRKAECKTEPYCTSAALRFPPSMSTDTNFDATENNELSRSIIQVCSDHTSGESLPKTEGRRLGRPCRGLFCPDASDAKGLTRLLPEGWDVMGHVDPKSELFSSEVTAGELDVVGSGTSWTRKRQGGVCRVNEGGVG